MFRRVIFGVLAFLGVAVVGAASYLFVFLPRLRPPPEVTAPTDMASIAHGEYLALHVTVCLGCHSENDTSIPGQPAKPGRLGSGGVIGTREEGFPGTIVALNLTPDVEFGIGGWSDGEVLRAIREGVSRDGRPLFPMMPYQTFAESLSDDDALDIIAYLRTLPPIHHDPGRTTLDMPFNLIVRTLPRPLARSAAPAPTAGIERGRWILKVASCADCHDAVDEKRNPIPGMHLAGGQALPVPGRGVVYARNLTSDVRTGIGGMTDDQVLGALTNGIGKDDMVLYQMPWAWYGGMTDDDKRALLLALREVPAVEHQVPRDTILRQASR